LVDKKEDVKGNKKRKRSIFSEAIDLEKRLAAARKRAAADRANSLTTQTARDDLSRQLLDKALRESLSQMFARVDEEQGGYFIHGSMQRLSADMWKKRS
jgi:hypothetical protein